MLTIKNNKIISLSLNNVENIKHNFLSHNTYLTLLNLTKVKKIGDCFLYCNESLTSIESPNIEKVGCFCLCYNRGKYEEIKRMIIKNYTLNVNLRNTECESANAVHWMCKTFYTLNV